MTTPDDFSVGQLAQLARVDLTPEEETRFSQELPAILEYVSQLQSVDLTGLEETAQVTGLENVLREDVLVELDDTELRSRRDALLAAAPVVREHLVQVPAILSEGGE